MVRVKFVNVEVKQEGGSSDNSIGDLTVRDRVG